MNYVFKIRRQTRPEHFPRLQESRIQRPSARSQGSQFLLSSARTHWSVRWGRVNQGVEENSSSDPPPPASEPLQRDGCHSTQLKLLQFGFVFNLGGMQTFKEMSEVNIPQSLELTPSFRLPPNIIPPLKFFLGFSTLLSLYSNLSPLISMPPVVPYPASSEHCSIALENMLGCSPGEVINVLGSGGMVGWWRTTERFLLFFHKSQH